MKRVKFSQYSRKYSIPFDHKVMRTLAALLVPLSILTSNISSFGEEPSAAIIAKFKGYGMHLRQGTNRNTKPLIPGQPPKQYRLREYEDKLYVPGDDTSEASFSLINQQVWEHGGLIISTIPSNVDSEYTFPCRGSGSFRMAWSRQGGSQRSCSDGAIVGPGSKEGISMVPFAITTKLIQDSKNVKLAQANDELNVGQVKIIPGSGETIVQAKTTDDGTIVVTVIVGNVSIESGRNRTTRRLIAPQKYTDSQNEIERDYDDCDKIANSPAMKEFVNPDNWLSPDLPERVATGLARQLREHQESLNAVDCYNDYYPN